jgi:glycosyltransferase involved in cell wall biosynthesis
MSPEPPATPASANRSAVPRMRPLRVLTWHIHGSYLYYLSHARQDFYLPVRADRSNGYGGRAGTFAWPDNVHEVPAEEVRRHRFDCVLFQSRRNWTHDQWEILSEEQRRLPRIYLEHDPPREHPTDTRHPVDDPNVLLVHVTPFNELMWDSGATPTTVIEHGVSVPEDVRYDGSLERGIVVINNLALRGRRLGADIFERVRRDVRLDLVGIGSGELGGLGEIPLPDLPAFEARYRFFFNPIRYTSLGLAVCEAMALGLPVVGLATAEMATVVENGVSGYIDTDVRKLVSAMRWLLAEPEEARRLGRGARLRARERFGIERFARDWGRTFHAVCGTPRTAAGGTSRRAGRVEVPA